MRFESRVLLLTNLQELRVSLVQYPVNSRIETSWIAENDTKVAGS